MDHVSTALLQSKQILAAASNHWGWKLIVSLSMSFASTLIGDENFTLIFLLFCLITLDLLTGMMAAVHQGEAIESRKAMKTATKAFVYLIFFASAHMVSQMVPYSKFIEIGVMSFLALTEFLSIVENIARMGYEIPQKLLNQVRDNSGIKHGEMPPMGSDKK